MSLTDAITARRLTLREAREKHSRDLALRYAREHATGATQRVLMAMLGEGAA